ncbi:unnamed protein product [Musa hybrid cultivar]
MIHRHPPCGSQIEWIVKANCRSISTTNQKDLKTISCKRPTSWAFSFSSVKGDNFGSQQRDSLVCVRKFIVY